jgi:hypothetical protein
VKLSSDLFQPRGGDLPLPKTRTETEDQLLATKAALNQCNADKLAIRDDISIIEQIQFGDTQ